jgi:RIO-like serine/threonine protein kinase
MTRKKISFRERSSIVWLKDGRIYKSQPKYNTDIEYHFLKLLEPSGYVPQDVRQEDVELISMEYIPPQQVTNINVFTSHYKPILRALKDAGIRHGDLTNQSLLIKNNKPIMIDFGESRWITDPIPSKRPDSDKTLLMTAILKKCEQNDSK